LTTNFDQVAFTGHAGNIDADGAPWTFEWFVSNISVPTVDHCAEFGPFDVDANTDYVLLRRFDLGWPSADSFFTDYAEGSGSLELLAP
jgi:hypothetical protein